MFYITQWGHYQFSTFERVHLSVKQMYACRWGPWVKEQTSLLLWMVALSVVVGPFLLSPLRHAGSPEDQVTSVSSPAGDQLESLWIIKLSRVTEDCVRSKPTTRPLSFIWIYHRFGDLLLQQMFLDVLIPLFGRYVVSDMLYLEHK